MTDLGQYVRAHIKELLAEVKGRKVVDKKPGIDYTTIEHLLEHVYHDLEDF